MAKTTLPTDFKDDVLDDSMNGKRRYNLIQNSDGTYSLEDVTTYTQVGSSFGQAQVNATNTAVNASVDKAVVMDSLSDIAANTTSGKVAGALAVRELNSNLDNCIGETPLIKHIGSSGDSYLYYNMILLNPKKYGYISMLVRRKGSLYYVSVNTSTASTSISTDGVKYEMVTGLEASEIGRVRAVLETDVTKVRIKFDFASAAPLDVLLLVPNISFDAKSAWASS